MDEIEVQFSRNVVAGGKHRTAGEVAALPPLDAFVVVLECNAGAFVREGDRERVIEAQRRENARVTGPARAAGSPWQPLGRF